MVAMPQFQQLEQRKEAEAIAQDPVLKDKAVRKRMRSGAYNEVCSPVVLALRRQRQHNHQEFQVSQSYIERCCFNNKGRWSGEAGARAW